jgi:hypothetical protein
VGSNGMSEQRDKGLWTPERIKAAQRDLASLGVETPFGLPASPEFIECTSSKCFGLKTASAKRQLLILS